MVISRHLLDEIINLARRSAPEEACGILAGRAARVDKAYPITNIEHSPRLYVIDPQQLQAVLDIEDRLGLEVVGTYHSHPTTEPRPSPTDIGQANWPGAEYVIVSLRDTGHPEVRVWSLDEGVAVERQLTVTD